MSRALAWRGEPNFVLMFIEVIQHTTKLANSKRLSNNKSVNRHPVHERLLFRLKKHFIKIINRLLAKPSGARYPMSAGCLEGPVEFLAAGR